MIDHLSPSGDNPKLLKGRGGDHPTVLTPHQHANPPAHLFIFRPMRPATRALGAERAASHPLTGEVLYTPALEAGGNGFSCSKVWSGQVR